MSETEFVLVAVSIMLGVAFARLLEGIYQIAMSGQARVAIIPLTWLLNRFVAGLIIFWTFKEGVYRNQTFDFAGFLVSFLPSIFLYLEATALATTRPGGVQSWSDQFERGRSAFFALATTAALGHALAMFYFDLAASPLAFLVSAAIFSLGLWSPGRRLQAFVAFVQSLFLLGALSVPLLSI